MLWASCQMSKPVDQNSGPAFRIVGYAGSGTDFSKIDPTRITHLNYAFALLRPDGSLYFEHEDAPGQLEQLRALKARHPHLEILLAIGGWGADHFSDVALVDSSRTRFAREAGAFVRRYGLDGIDLDWEFPGQPGPGIGYREEDRENFTLLVGAVRKQLDAMSEQDGRTGNDRYLLTMAANHDEVYLENVEMDTLHTLVDFINLMTYDFYTVGARSTGHHTALYSSYHEEAAPGYTASAGVERYLAAGVPPGKIVLGVAFYGRGWSGVHARDQGLYQAYEAFDGTYGYDFLVEHRVDKNGFTRYWDAVAKAPFLWNRDSSIFISYEDPESLRHKASFVREKGLGGVMYWEQRFDPEGMLVDVLYYALAQQKKGPAPEEQAPFE